MRETVMEHMERVGLVPVVVMGEAESAAPAARAMLRGGVDVMEITLRTSAGLEALRRAADEGVLTGAGTVLSLSQCRQALRAGARFIVSPGFSEEVVEECLSRGVPVLPGCVTPTEIMRALEKGLDVLKFFPANVYGGMKGIKALSSPFPGVRFVPTGGVSAENLHEYVHPAVYAVGGSWMCPQSLIDAGRFDEITQLCRRSVEALRQARERAV